MKAWLLAIAIILSTSLLPIAYSQPTLQQCQNTLSLCNKVVQDQDAQIKLLQQEVKDWQKQARVDSPNALKWGYLATGLASGAFAGGSLAGTHGLVIGAIGGVITGLALSEVLP